MNFSIFSSYTNTSLRQNYPSFKWLFLLGCLFFAFTIQAQKTWTGATDTDWNTASNWSPVGVPLATEDVIIPDVANDPDIMNGTNAVAKSVVVETDAILDILTGGSLTIDGDGTAHTGIANDGTVNNDGTINIDNLYPDAAGIRNVSNAFTNQGTINMGSNGGTIGEFGIDNRADFINDNGGEINIEGLFPGDGHGILNRSNTFTNRSTINIGANKYAGEFGIENWATFINDNGGEINIDNSNFTGIFNSSNTFTNKAIINIGANTDVGDKGIQNDGNFTNETCALVNIASDDPIKDSGTFTNNGNIVENASGNSHITNNNGIVQNLNGGTFSITNDNGSLIENTGTIWTGCINTDWNTPGNWVPEAVPTIADEVIIPNVLFDPVIDAAISAFAKSVSIESGARLTVAGFCTLTIDGSTGPGLTNQGYFNNFGQVNIGQTTGVNGQGMLNTGDCVNGGVIYIDNTLEDGIRNRGPFENTGQLNIGQNGGIDNIGNMGIWADDDRLRNGPNGEINIDQTNSHGLQVGVNGNCNNSGMIKIGQNGGTGSIDGAGVRVVSEIIRNFAQGTIIIDNTTGDGYFQDNNTVVSNYGIFLIGTNGGINNIEGGALVIMGSTLVNEACGVVQLDDAINILNSSSIQNFGLLTVNTTQSHTNDGNFINEGIVQYTQLPLIPDATNNEIVIAPTIDECNEADPAFDLGANIDFTILGIFTDENATQSAGTYDSNTNIFTSNAGLGQADLYVQIADPANGCTRIVSWSIDIVDNTPPTPICNNPTVELDGNGNYALLETDVFDANTSADNCGTVNFVGMSITEVDCSNINNPVSVTVTVNDGNGNENTCTATVTVEDNIAPTPTCLNPTVVLDVNGSYVIQQSDVLGTNNDNCTVINLWDVVPAEVDCSNAGTVVPVTVTIYDSSNNPATCTANVTVEDNQDPVPACLNPTVSLNASGTHSLTENEVFNGGTDNCGPVTFVSVSPAVVDCDNISVPIAVTVTAQDASGNQATCTATVTVVDDLPPVITCANATVELNADGEATITQATTFTGSSDNCGFIGLEPLAQEVFTCGDIGANTVVLNGFDGNGNTTSCAATVTIEDNVAPNAKCVANPISAILNTNGEYTVDPTNLDDGSSDACGIQSLSASPALLDCSDEGANTVTLTVTDVNGNTSTCNATVEVAPFFSINSITENAETCTGTGDGSIVIEATTGGGQIGYSIDGGSNFQFGNTFTSLTPDTYNIVVKIFGINAACEKTATATIEAGTQSQTRYRDMDGDQYSDGTSVNSCSQPSGYYPAGELLATSGDCNDSEANIHPGATEICDGLDNNCDGQLMSGEVDADGDGYFVCDGDCNDNDPTVHPGATEICNGIDDDCDGEIDEGTSGGLTFTGNVAFYTQAAVDAFSQCHSIIDGNVTILGNNITDLSNLSNIEEITGSLTIQTTGLASMNGLGNLVEVGGMLTIYYNSSLTTLNGLDVLGAVGGNLSVYYNFTLSDACAIYNLINGGVSGSMSIFLNAVGANSVAEINANCGPNNRAIDSTDPDEINAEPLGQTTKTKAGNSLKVFPNPASHMTTLQLEEAQSAGVVRLMDLTGRTLLKLDIEPGTDRVNLQLIDLKAGTYFVQLNIEGQRLQTKKLIIIE
ncbi:MAG: MopE-related protein [Bacteroidota bacterium]